MPYNCLINIKISLCYDQLRHLALSLILPLSLLFVMSWRDRRDAYVCYHEFLNYHKNTNSFIYYNAWHNRLLLLIIILVNAKKQLRFLFGAHLGKWMPWASERTILKECINKWKYSDPVGSMTSKSYCPLPKCSGHGPKD